MTGRIQHYIDRLHQTRLELFDESNRKRPAPSEPTDGLNQVKRQRLGADVHTIPPQQPAGPPPIPPGPTSFAQLFTLTQDPVTKVFDVTQVPIDLVTRILVPVLRTIDSEKLNNAVNVRVRHRH